MIRSFAGAATGILALALASLLSVPLSAKEIKCADDEISVTDDRPEGGNLCLKKSEWEKAREECAKDAEGDEVDPMDCICQDGDKVAACGE